MSDFHQNLDAALSEEDEAFLKRLDDEPGLIQQMSNAFQGKLKFWTAYAFVMSFVLFGVAVFCVWNLFQAESTRDLVLWATGVWCTMLSVGLIKVWFWMRMNHLAVLREIKRVELYLARNTVA